MTEPVEVLVLNALLGRLVTSASGTIPGTSNITTPATPVASPLANYAPTLGTSYLHAHPLLRAEPDAPGLAADSAVIRRGVFQVDAVVPDNRGEAPGLRLAALVRDRFARGTKLVAGTRYLRLDKEPTIAAAVKDAPWVRFPVSIPFEIIGD